VRFFCWPSDYILLLLWGYLMLYELEAREVLDSSLFSLESIRKDLDRV